MLIHADATRPQFLDELNALCNFSEVCLHQGGEMSKTYIRRRSCSGHFIAITAMLFSAASHGQTSALLEACNSLDDKDKRLACFREISNLKNSGATDATAGKRVKNAFAAIAGAVNSGISFNNYSVMILEPAKEVGIFRQEVPPPNPRVLDLFDQALVSYREAEKVWHASIYNGSDSGVFGRVLNPKYTGLLDIVRKYNLPTRTVLFNDHLPVDTALPIIWRYAEERAKAAVELLESSNTGEVKAAAKTPNSPSTFVPAAGKFQWPLVGAVIVSYDGETSQGIEIEGKVGDPVLAAADGVVAFAGSTLPGWGNMLIIKHDDIYSTAYARNATILVTLGDKVKKGQNVAVLGSIGSDRVQLHFQVRRSGMPIDPMPYLPTK